MHTQWLVIANNLFTNFDKSLRHFDGLKTRISYYPIVRECKNMGSNQATGLRRH